MSREIKSLTKDYTLSTQKEGWAGDELYQLSCLMRIADATEAMAKNHVQLIRDRDNYERWYREEQERVKKLQASNASLRGVITRMKNKEKQTIQKEPEPAGS